MEKSSRREGKMQVVGVRKKILLWLGREFVFLSCEGMNIGTATDQMEGIFDCIKAELQRENLSLDQIVRTRLWAVDRKSRDMGSDVRAKYNVGQARAATSSYIMPAHFASDALVGLDVIALKPSGTNIKKLLVESVPPRTPLSYLIFDSLLVLSGKTVILPTLSEQLDEILPRITGILLQAESSWNRVVNVSCYLHKSQTINTLLDSFKKLVDAPLSRMKIVPVEGYSAEGKLIEIEITAETTR
jgi:enamine deaminase RidA (YjgF/YER057c/UK114 family)